MPDDSCTPTLCNMIIDSMHGNCMVVAWQLKCMLAAGSWEDQSATGECKVKVHWYFMLKVLQSVLK